MRVDARLDGRIRQRRARRDHRRVARALVDRPDVAVDVDGHALAAAAPGARHHREHARIVGVEADDAGVPARGPHPAGRVRGDAVTVLADVLDRPARGHRIVAADGGAAVHAEPHTLLLVDGDAVRVVAAGDRDVLLDAVHARVVADGHVARGGGGAAVGVDAAEASPRAPGDPQVAHAIEREAVVVRGRGCADDDRAGVAVELPHHALPAADPHRGDEVAVGVVGVLRGRGAEDAAVGQRGVPEDAVVLAPRQHVGRSGGGADHAITVGVGAVRAERRDARGGAPAAVRDEDVAEAVHRGAARVLGLATDRAGAVARDLDVRARVDLRDGALSGVRDPDERRVDAARVELDRAVHRQAHALRLVGVEIEALAARARARAHAGGIAGAAGVRHALVDDLVAVVVAAVADLVGGHRRRGRAVAPDHRHDGVRLSASIATPRRGPPRAHARDAHLAGLALRARPAGARRGATAVTRSQPQRGRGEGCQRDQPHRDDCHQGSPRPGESKPHPHGRWEHRGTQT
jgi:hypothetical protein